MKDNLFICVTKAMGIWGLKILFHKNKNIKIPGIPKLNHGKNNKNV